MKTLLVIILGLIAWYIDTYCFMLLGNMKYHCDTIALNAGIILTMIILGIGFVMIPISIYVWILKKL